VDKLSHGRLIAGIGAGHVKEEFDVLSGPSSFERRGGATDEAISALAKCLGEEAAAHQYLRWQFSGMHIGPRAVQRPRPALWIGGSSARALRRAAAYGSSLDILRSLVPEQREVANLLDDIQIRAKVRGVTVADFSVLTPVEGPAPFDTYSYSMAVIGRYHQVGSFLTDVASLRRIMVSSDLKLAAANITQARVLGDTTAMIEARFTIRTYVKAKADSTITEEPDAP